MRLLRLGKRQTLKGRECRRAEIGIRSGNWHLFPIDKHLLERRMAIAGARAFEPPPGRCAGTGQTGKESK